MTALPDAGIADAALPDAGVADAALPPDVERWVTTWGTTLVDFGPHDWLSLESATVRQVIHTSVGGAAVRVRFSNAFGTKPLEISAAHIALSASGSSIVASSDRKLTFAGADSVTIPAGHELQSDPIAFEVPAQSNLAISIDLPELTVAKTAAKLRDPDALCRRPDRCRRCRRPHGRRYVQPRGHSWKPSTWRPRLR